MSGTRRNTKRVYTQKDTRSFYLVANDVFYGLIFSSTQEFYFKKNRNLLSIPSLLFYDNQNKVIIDYSNSKNEDDLSYVSSFFNSLTPGITFTIQDALYVDDKSQIQANLSGTFSFTSFDQGKIIRAEVVSTSRLIESNDSYFSKFFTQVPQLFKSSSTLSSKQQKQSIIKNSLSNGIYSFKRMGIQVGDYVEFGGTTSNDNKKLKVIDLFTDADGFENILADEEIISEDLIGQPVLLNLFYTGDKQSNPNLNDKTYGVCMSNATCTQAQNEFLCKEIIEKNQQTFLYYSPNQECQDELEERNRFMQQLDGVEQGNRITQPSVLEQRNRLIQEISRIEQRNRITQPTENTSSSLFTNNNLSGSEASVLRSIQPIVRNYSVRPKIFGKSISLKISKNSFVIDEKETKEITVNKNTNLKFILDNPSLKSYSFKFSNSENTLQEITENVLVLGTPGSSNSYSSIYTGSTDKIIYFVSNNLKTKLKIIVK
jgi:hypothetical protein